MGLLPNGRSCGKLYLRPKAKPTPSVWYSDQPYGKNKIASTVRDLCKHAKIDGKFSNHSLRATSASRMYQQRVDEQVIKEITGHKSDCVRVYKRTNENLLKNASKCISGEDLQKDVKKHEKDTNVETEKFEVGKVEKKQSKKKDISGDIGGLSACQIIKNVVKTRMEMRKKKLKSRVGIRKVASKILKARKARMVKHYNSRIGQSRKLIIDLNVNVNCQK